MSTSPGRQVTGCCLHFNADYNWFVYPDQGYCGLLSNRGNFLAGKECSPSEAARMEIE